MLESHCTSSDLSKYLQTNPEDFLYHAESVAFEILSLCQKLGIFLYVSYSEMKFDIIKNQQLITLPS